METCTSGNSSQTLTLLQHILICVNAGRSSENNSVEEQLMLGHYTSVGVLCHSSP